MSTYPTAKTSDAYTPGVAVWPSGRTQRCNVKRAALQDAATARAALRSGAVCVYVRLDDAPDVAAWGAGE